ncbi:saccharopine dehydrogenase family protein [Pseudonocardia oroxyli]|uniref:Saccharopine dehydrogenase, NADP-dependent n=1 Tax=Pseudonocardia oroxyli TaxID=366584 RepID=A0A1G7GPX3_PSEOR|nr:saccharopine dehydrogenase C-terminal domain-containing protein [Pseudonocardia oroxyli]SDE90156.1 Saccharopine dehydrogenase, NADP-dependent [Pseudonocardia oroxyli]
MRILLVGAGGVGGASAAVAARRGFVEAMVVADYELGRAEAVVAKVGDPRFVAARVDAADRGAVEELIRAHRVDAVLNACDPRFVMPLFRACLATRVTYLDMAMSMSDAASGRMLGEEQFALAESFAEAGVLALVGMGVEPGLSDVFARYAADHLFSEVHTFDVRDGANLAVPGRGFAPPFSIWTLIEECLNPPVVWERGRGWFTTEPFSEPEVFDFPAGIGPLECVNVEHEEVLLIPRWLDAQRVTFKYGLGAEVIGVLRMLHELGLDATTPVKVRAGDGYAEVSPREVVAACLPDPATLEMTGTTCAGVRVTGLGPDGAPRAVYLHHVVDNEWSMREYGCQAVVWQTGVNPVVALELIATGAWAGAGVRGPESFDARPFLDLLTAYGSPWALREDRMTAR